MHHLLTATFCCYLFANSMYACENQDTKLHQYVRSGDVQQVKNLLARNVPVDIKGFYNNTPLHIASSNKRKEIATILLAAGADVNAINDNGDTPLHLACSEESKKTVNILLNGPFMNAMFCNPNIRNNNGSTPLHSAVWWGRLAIVKTLLANHADIDLPDKKGQTSLIYAAYLGNTEIANSLLAAGADPDIRDRDGTTALYFAASKGHLNMVKIVAAKTKNVDSQRISGDTPLMIATDHGFSNIAAILLAAGANPVIRRTIDYATALHIAAYNEHDETANVLLAADATSDCRDIYGNTPLIVAAYEGRTSLVLLLLSYGADPNVKSKSGIKASDVPADTENRQQIKHLLTVWPDFIRTLRPSWMMCASAIQIRCGAQSLLGIVGPDLIKKICVRSTGFYSPEEIDQRATSKQTSNQTCSCK